MLKPHYSGNVGWMQPHLHLWKWKVHGHAFFQNCRRPKQLLKLGFKTEFAVLRWHCDWNHWVDVFLGLGYIISYSSILKWQNREKSAFYGQFVCSVFGLCCHVFFFKCLPYHRVLLGCWSLHRWACCCWSFLVDWSGSWKLLKYDRDYNELCRSNNFDILVSFLLDHSQLVLLALVWCLCTWIFTICCGVHSREPKILLHSLTVRKSQSNFLLDRKDKQIKAGSLSFHQQSCVWHRSSCQRKENHPNSVSEHLRQWRGLSSVNRQTQRIVHCLADS